MSDQWKPGDEAMIGVNRRVKLIGPCSTLPGYYWAGNPGDCDSHFVVHRNRLSPVPRLDPRESDPVAMQPPPPPATEPPKAGKVMHDGQANTSGVVREPMGRCLASAILDAYRQHATPSTLTVLEGIGRWQRQDPRHRQVHVTLTGHVVVATVALLDGSAPRLIKFVRPFPAADVIGFLDGLIAVPPHEPVTMGRIDFDPQEAR